MVISFGEHFVTTTSGGSMEMAIDLSTKGKLLFRGATHTFLSVCFISALLILSAIVDSRSSKDFVASVQAVFRNDQIIGNTALLNRRMADLEALGIVSCLTIENSHGGEIFNTTFKDGCERSTWLNRFRWSNGTLSAVTGDKFNFSFKMTPSPWYSPMFFVMFIFGLGAINGGLLLVWVAIDAKSREIDLQKKIVELAAQVSHDIRSPLSALNVAVSRLNSVPEDDRIFIRQVSGRIQSVADELLRSYKDFGMDKNDRRDMLRLDRFLNSIFQEKRTLFAEDKKIEFILDSPENPNSICAVDEKKLARAVSNLINNAAEAIVDQGSVTLGLRTFGEKTVGIIVSDNGAGIPPEILNQLGLKKISYGKVQGDSGYGMGFIQSKAAIEEMGGKLEIQSKVGKGTMVTILFPIVK